FRPVACPDVLHTTSLCHNFNGNPVSPDATYGFTLAAGATIDIDFQWAEPRFGVTQDFDIFLLNVGVTPNTILATSTDNNPGPLPTGTQKPAESISYKNTSGAAQNLAFGIARFSGTTPRMKFLFFRTSGISNVEYPT